MWRCTSHNIPVFTVHGRDNGQFNFPITVDGEGNFLVTDREHHIQKFTEEGRFLTGICTKGTSSH